MVSSIHRHRGGPRVINRARRHCWPASLARDPARVPRGTSTAQQGPALPADPPTVEEIIAVMHAAGDDAKGVRLRGLIVVLWRAGLRVSEALALSESNARLGWPASRRVPRARRARGVRRWPWWGATGAFLYRSQRSQPRTHQPIRSWHLGTFARRASRRTSGCLRQRLAASRRGESSQSAPEPRRGTRVVMRWLRCP